MKVAKFPLRPVKILLVFLACAVVFWAEYGRPVLLERFDEGLKDFLVQRMADPAPENRVVVVDIDDESIRQFGTWPWPRSQIADLLEMLLIDYQARAVGVDIVFPEVRDSLGDLRLAALAEHAPLVLAQVFDFTPRYPNLNQGMLGRAGNGLLTGDASAGVPAFGYVGNHAALSRARCVGNIGYQPDADGVLRRTPLQVAYENQAYSQFAVALLDCAANPPVSLPAMPAGKPWRIPFRHALESYIVLPAAAVFRHEIPPELVRGRFVVIGSSSLGLGDRVGIPLAPLVSGVMVHAQSLSALLDLAEGKARPPWSGRLPLALWTLLTTAFAVFCVARLSAWNSILLLLGMALVSLTLTSWGFLHQAEWSILAPLTGYFLLLITAIPHEWWQTQRRNLQNLEILSHYVAKPVLEELQRRGETYSLKPTLKEVTVLIADMEGYTRLTSALSLEDAAQMTKSFLDCLTRPTLENGGTLDKYSGDGMVAFWGAPLDCPDQADRAVETALAILREVRALNREQSRRKLPAVRVRIGIESGKALVGDLGTPFRSTYTAVGDCINFASRLESAAKSLPFSLVIGEAANARLQRHATRSAGEIQLRDTSTVLPIYTAITENQGSEDV
ncbi:MAG: adenylate/guanylate cyclase domain-containing protein [Zoogloeaceae bacterium]|jgi:adenylate cyclase|nr:adenylate/guanylate cyclase domain-containing protein [Zoogloeaceae bacterium]